MADAKRAFILGAGFSKPAGMPLATELLPLLSAVRELDDMRAWLEHMCERLAWLTGDGHREGVFGLNIEQVFHYAYFDAEVFRLKQHLERVGRRDGPGTSWNQAESFATWLSYLEEDLRDVILEREDECNLDPISRWANLVSERDAVLTFNYDTLPERALTQEQKLWNHGFELEPHEGTPIFKLHGSIDWIVGDRSESLSKLDLLFDKVNENRHGERTGDVEEDCCLWRCRGRDQLGNWIRGRDLHNRRSWLTVGIAGLGTYKPLHKIPGLGQAWSRGMKALYQADHAVIVGFSMSDFDAMAQMQFAGVARARIREGRPLRVTVIDPGIADDPAARKRFESVFRKVDPVTLRHEQFDWSDVV